MPRESVGRQRYTCIRAVVQAVVANSVPLMPASVDFTLQAQMSNTVRDVAQEGAFLPSTVLEGRSQLSRQRIVDTVSVCLQATEWNFSGPDAGASYASRREPSQTPSVSP